MNENLMIHVERIVRPVQARCSRKLRMRRELLSHLQAALDEERAHHPDETSAVEQAKRRLGNPSDITAQLQESVPRFERMMYAPIPEPCLGSIGPLRITLMFALRIAAGLGLLATLGFIFALTGCNFVLMDGIRVCISLLALNIYATLIIRVSYERLAETIVVTSHRRARQVMAVGYGVLVVAVQMLGAVVAMQWMAHRPAGSIGIAGILAISAGSVGVAAMIMRAVARMPASELKKWNDLELAA